MNVEIVAATQFPIDVISRAAGTCYGNDWSSHKRVVNCRNSGHMSVFEHASITFKIEGISRACSHQLVRHRMASYCQESQRYVKHSYLGEDWYVMPPEIKKHIELEQFFKVQMAAAAMEYRKALNEGINPEDARFLLPEATKTNVTMTMNVRELFHFLDLRTDKKAQWEIRDLANEMIRIIKDYADSEWFDLVLLWEGNHE